METAVAINWLTLALAILDVLLIPAVYQLARVLWSLDRRLGDLEIVLKEKGIIRAT